MNSIMIGLPGQPPQIVLRMVGRAAGDDRGFMINPSGFKGWTDGGSLRSTRSDRPLGHGQFDAPGYLNARVLTFSGHALADSAADLDQLRYQLTSVLNGGQLGRVTVAYEGKTLWANCRLESAKCEPMASDPSVGDFLIQLVCPDPRKYGDTREFSAGQLAFHRGNAEAYPVFTIKGPTIGGYTLSGPDGKQWVVPVPMPSTETHTIDMATGVLRVNGQVRYGLAVRSDMWSIPGGTKVAHSVNGGTLTVRLTDTEI
ncbi:hypothetical protein M2390_000502 [Mycetocola sp. BIGb0189]|uniref:phage tail family protein n=1 Tax=Mycetocola sp. BIGb0189 TaxID=2940604 RepID=UPI00216AA06B|nr:phage tail family protein [Mycetocola sp. BIGb0189]MCS4275341.1 hypothetical protein [Mycetocola sp. BIGb0189]